MKYRYMIKRAFVALTAIIIFLGCTTKNEKQDPTLPVVISGKL
jgi:uncharacterized lipoprotein YajG